MLLTLSIIATCACYAEADIALADLSSFSKAIDSATPADRLAIAQAVFESGIADTEKRTKLEILANKMADNTSTRAMILDAIEDYQQSIEDNIAMIRNLASPAQVSIQILSPNNPDRFKKYLVYLLQFSNASNAQKQEIVRYLSTMTRYLPKDFSRAQFGPLAQLVLSFINSPTSSSFLNHVIESNVPNKAFYVKYLLEGGANPEQADSSGATPLQIAPNAEIKQSILDAQASR